MTKKEVYSTFGVIYDPKTTKIFSRRFGWIRPLLVNGNDKLGKGVWAWSIMPTNEDIAVNMGTKSLPDWQLIRGTCPCHCPGCYACEGCYKFNSTKQSLARKTILAREDLDFMINAIIAQIVADSIKVLRVHVAGDFFSDDYIRAWREISRVCSDAVMWTYTKNPVAVSAFDDRPNFNVVRSVVPGIGLNYGHCDHIIAAYEYLIERGEDVYICRCSIDKNQHCKGCEGCQAHKYVLFLEHSTGYKGEDDPLYPALVALIEGQVRAAA